MSTLCNLRVEGLNLKLINMNLVPETFAGKCRFMFDPDASAKEKKNKKNLNKRRQIIYLAVDIVIQIWKKKTMKMMMQGNRNLWKGHGTEAEDDGC